MRFRCATSESPEMGGWQVSKCRLAADCRSAALGVGCEQCVRTLRQPAKKQINGPKGIEMLY